MTLQAQSPCIKCAGQAQPGTVALMKYLMLRFPKTGSMGIYNCRSVAGSSPLSKHSCGRAGDSKIPTTASGGAIVSIGNPLVQFLIEYSTFLGIQLVIYNRVYYSATAPKGAYYNGVHPHRDHAHWEHLMSKAKSLTFAQIEAHCGKVTTTPPSTDWTTGVIMALPTIKQGDKGDDVGRGQGLLLAAGFKDKNSNKPETAVDEIFGPGTHTATIGFQKSKGLKQDGVIGKNTWTKLLGQ